MKEVASSVSARDFFMFAGFSIGHLTNLSTGEMF